MTYLVFDSETETHHSHKRKANPFNPDNYVVLRGWKKQGDKRASAQRFESKEQPENWLYIPDDVGLLVGHNVKYDLLYEMQAGNPYLKAFYKRGGRIWCTQYAEYLLRAQEQAAQMCSMDSIVESYGGRLKVDGLKALWEAGVKTSEIDPDLLLNYLIDTEEHKYGDIGNTELIYLGQIQAAEDLGMTQAIKLRMDGLAATTEMEFNGLKVDVKRAGVNLKKLNVRHAEATKELEQYTSHIPAEVGFSWGSPVHKSAIIFGGTIKYQKQDTYLDEKTGDLARYKEKEAWPLFDGKPYNPKKLAAAGATQNEDGLWSIKHRVQDQFKSGKKAGEPKTKQVDVPGELKVKYQDFFYDLPGYTKPDPEWKGKNTDGKGNPVYGTGSEVIERLGKRDIPFLKTMSKLLALNKEIGTYYIRYDEKKKTHVGMLTCVQKWDHIVHHSLNHTNTKTTRLSANNPNMQNVTRADFDASTGEYKSEVKAIFVSRFGDDGEMLEADYSQLEVVVQGLLSLDDNLCKDLINRVDFHCKRVALKNSVSYEFALEHCKNAECDDYAKWKKERTKCKIFSFQR